MATKNQLKNEILTLKTEESNLTYGDLLTSCLNVVPEKGFTAEEMGKRLAVLKVIKETKPGKIFDLKAAEIMTIKTSVSQMKWAMLHEDILAFSKTVEAL